MKFSTIFSLCCFSLGPILLIAFACGNWKTLVSRWKIEAEWRACRRQIKRDERTMAQIRRKYGWN